MEKDVRFDLEDRLEDGDEGMGFIDGSRKVCGCQAFASEDID